MRHLDEALLNEYLDEALDQPARRAVEAHLGSCPDCRARLDDLRMVFYNLSLLGEKSLAHDLAPGILDRLPGPALPLGWKLALALQAGVAMGLLGAIGQVMLSAVRPVVDARPLTNAWIDLSGRVSLPIPDSAIRPLDLSGYSLPLSAPVTVVLLVMVVILWGLGNARLLRNGYEV
jgi:hypothetical protein